MFRPWQELFLTMRGMFVPVCLGIEGMNYAAVKKWNEESGDMKDWNSYMPLGYGRPTGPTIPSGLPQIPQAAFGRGASIGAEVVRDDALSFLKPLSKKTLRFLCTWSLMQLMIHGRRF
ncbi:MAG: hypothetical protein R2814_08530 [Flavobacteriaceae bacterium]